MRVRDGSRRNCWMLLALASCTDDSVSEIERVNLSENTPPPSLEQKTKVKTERLKPIQLSVERREPETTWLLSIPTGSDDIGGHAYFHPKIGPDRASSGQAKKLGEVSAAACYEGAEPEREATRLSVRTEDGYKPAVVLAHTTAVTYEVERVHQPLVLFIAGPAIQAREFLCPDAPVVKSVGPGLHAVKKVFVLQEYRQGQRRGQHTWVQLEDHYLWLESHAVLVKAPVCWKKRQEIKGLKKKSFTLWRKSGESCSIRTRKLKGNGFLVGSAADMREDDPVKLLALQYTGTEGECGQGRWWIRRKELLRSNVSVVPPLMDFGTCDIVPLITGDESNGAPKVEERKEKPVQLAPERPPKEKDLNLLCRSVLRRGQDCAALERAATEAIEGYNLALSAFWDEVGFGVSASPSSLSLLECQPEHKVVRIQVRNPGGAWQANLLKEYPVFDRVLLRTLIRAAFRFTSAETVKVRIGEAPEVSFPIEHCLCLLHAVDVPSLSRDFDQCVREGPHASNR